MTADKRSPAIVPIGSSCRDDHSDGGQWHGICPGCDTSGVVNERAEMGQSGRFIPLHRDASSRSEARIASSAPALLSRLSACARPTQKRRVMSMNSALCPHRPSPSPAPATCHKPDLISASPDCSVSVRPPQQPALCPACA